MRSTRKRGLAAVTAGILCLTAIPQAVWTVGAASLWSEETETAITASLQGLAGDHCYYGEGVDGNSEAITAASASVTGEGQYSVSWRFFSDDADGFDLLYLELESDDGKEVTTDAYPNLNITIDEISIDGESDAYAGIGGYADLAYYSGGTGKSRVYLADAFGTLAAETPDGTEILQSAAMAQSIKVTFTITGLNEVHYGDVSDDGDLSAFDASSILNEYMQSTIAGETSEWTDQQTLVADVNRDGAIDLMDASLVYGYANLSALGADLDWNTFRQTTVTERNVETVSVSMPDVFVTLDELAANDYEVAIPVTVPLEGVSRLSMGFALQDTLTFEEFTSSDDSIPTYQTTDNMFWVSDISGEDCGTLEDMILTVKLRESVMEGDSFFISCEENSPAGGTAFCGSGTTDYAISCAGATITVMGESAEEPGLTAEDLEIGLENIEITEDELINNNYEVIVPVYVSGDFSELSFGVECGENAEITNVATYENGNFSATYDMDQNMYWFTSGSSGSQGYILDLYVQLPADILPGDVYVVRGTAGSGDSAASWKDPDGNVGGMIFPEGTITVVESEVGEGRIKIDGITYEKNESGSTASVVDCSGSVTDAVICSEVEGVPVTSIGYSAFSGCSSLESVTIPDTVTYIDGYAFAYCSGLKSITVPGSVTDISYDAFYSCENLKEVNLSDGLTEIGSEAFGMCTALESIRIPDSVKYIYSYAFAWDTVLKEIVIPESVIEIGGNAFLDTSWLEAKRAENPLVVVNGILVDGRTCSDETVIPDQVTSICSYAFQDNTDLKTITIPSSVTTINYDVFYGSSLAEVYYTGTIDQWNNMNISSNQELNHALIHCSDGEASIFDNGVIYRLKSDGTAYVADYDGEAKTLEIPSEIQGHRVVGIRDDAFCYCETLEEVTIAEGVETIEYDAFWNCTNLRTIHLPDSLTSIGSDAFWYCTSLESITLPIGLKYLGSDVFYGCSGLQEVTYAGTISQWYAIDRGTDRGLKQHVIHCSNGDATVIYNNVVYELRSVSEAAAVGYATGTTRLEIASEVEGRTVKTISSDAFSQMDTLEELVIGEGVEQIYDSAFLGCVNLRQVTLPESLRKIGSYAFEYCSALESIVLPAALYEIGNDVFNDCSSLQNISYGGTISKWYAIYSGYDSVPKNLIVHCSDGDAAVVYNNVLYELRSAEEAVAVSCATATTKMTIAGEVEGRTVKTIGSQLFYDNPVIEEVTIGEGVTMISNDAFGCCRNLQRVTLPDSLETISYEAFFNCRNLQAITLPEGLKTIGSFAFANCGSLTEIQLPESLKSLGYEAFSGCNSLETVTYAGTVSQWFEVERSFDKRLRQLVIHCSDGDATMVYDNVVYELQSADTAVAVGFATGTTKLTVASEVDGHTVKKIDNEAFSYLSTLEEVVISEGIEQIGHSAFYNCNNLQRVTLPDSLKTIGASAFYDCGSLTEILLPEGLESIGYDALDGQETNPDLVIRYAGTLKQWNAIEKYSDQQKQMVHCSDGDTLFLVEPLQYYDNGDGTVQVIACVEELPAEFEIPEKVDGKTVTRIRDYAFSGQQKLESLTIGTNVTQVGYNICQECPAMKDVYYGGTIDQWLEVRSYLGEGILEHCSDGDMTVYQDNLVYEIQYDGKMSVTGCTKDDIQTVVIAGKVNGREVDAIAYEAFSGLKQLKKVTIPDSVTSIYSCAFQDCAALTSVTLPASLTYLSEYVFSGCTSLTEITLPEGMTDIDYGLFYGCTSLKTVSIPDGVRYIHGETFYNCTSLTEIAIPSSVTYIGNAFETQDGKNVLEDVYYDGTIEEWKQIDIDKTNLALEQAVVHCTDGDIPAIVSQDVIDGITYGTRSNGEVVVISCNNQLSSVEIPAKINGNPVVEIRTAAFKWCSALSSITLPDSIVRIGDNAFSYSGLTSIELPDSVTEIGEGVFDNCTALAAAVLPEHLTELPKFTFYNCRMLTQVTLPKKLKSIGNNAFDDCYALESINLPDGLTSIGNYAFRSCSALSEISIPSSLTEIGVSAFQRTAWMKAQKEKNPLVVVNSMLVDGSSCSGSVVIPDNVTKICGYAFMNYEGDSEITAVTIPTSVTAIGSSAFYGCEKMEEIYIPDSVTSIGDYAFNYCTSLKEITIPASITELKEGTFASCSALEQIQLPETLQTIGEYVFAGMENMKSIYIPESVSQFGYGNFGYQTIDIYYGGSEAQWDAVIEETWNTVTMANGDELDGYVLHYNSSPDSASGDDPSTGGDDPSTGGDDPSTGGDDPSTGGDDPSTGGDDPSTGGDDPSTGGDDPSTGGDDPSTGGDDPGASGDDPSKSVELMGDVDGNGKINTMDAYQVLLYTAQSAVKGETSLTDDQLKAADVNNDGKVNTMDAYYILLYTAMEGAKYETTWEIVLSM